MLTVSKFEKYIIIFFTVFFVAAAVPNFILEKHRYSVLPDFIANHGTVNFGIDLQGGARFLFEIGLDQLLKEHMETLSDALRRGEYSLLSQGIKRYTGLRIIDNDTIAVRITKEEDVAAAGIALKFLEQHQSINSLHNDHESLNVELQDDRRTYHLSLTENAQATIIKSAMQQTLEIMRNRIDELGTKDPIIQQQGTKYVMVQIPGTNDISPAIFGQTARLTIHTVQDTFNSTAYDQRRSANSGSLILPFKDQQGLLANVDKIPIISGENLKNARLAYDPNTKQPIVNFILDIEGTKKFATATIENIGNSIAIVIDGHIISAPVVREPILGGSGQISGNFTTESANNLAVILRSGALPAPLKIVESSRIGPELGKEALQQGMTALVIAFIMVAVYMIATYGYAGVFASIALSVNFMMLIGILSLLGATLTLPGIGGIILTLGIAVDGSIIIFERIRELKKKNENMNIHSLIQTGYSMANSAIYDANITTLIVMLFIFTISAGPIRGFSITLSIGVVTSVFTSVYFTRMLLISWIESRNIKKLSF